MNAGTPPALKVRKTPRQAQARVTVDAIFEATLQVLICEGMRQLTTTRVAERAGVSVGTMYQCFSEQAGADLRAQRALPGHLGRED